MDTVATQPGATRVPGAEDPAAILALSTLELRALRVVDGFRRGLHRSPHRGFSVEVSDARAYVPGDDVRFIDWRLLARTDRLYVKRFEDETNLRGHVLFDASASMAFGAKAAYAATLAAAFAHLLAGQGDAVGVVRFSDRPLQVVPARVRAGHLARIERVLSEPPLGQVTDVARTLADVAAVVPRRGLLLLISDLLANVADLGRQLGALSALGHEVAVLQIACPAELGFSVQRPVRLRDLESGAVLAVDPREVGDSYRAARAAHDATVRSACLNAGVQHQLVVTDRPFEDALFTFVQQRALRRGRR